MPPASIRARPAAWLLAVPALVAGCDSSVGPEENAAPTVYIQIPVADGAEFHEGEPTLLSARASDAEDGDLSESVEWSSSVDGALGTGQSLEPALSVNGHTITAQVRDAGGLVASATRELTVLPRPRLEITLARSEPSFLVNDTVTASVLGFDDTGAAVQLSTVTWRSSDTGVASVDPSGLMTFTGRGSAVVSVEASGASDSVDVRVQGILHSSPPAGRVTWMLVDTPHVVPRYLHVGTPDTTVITIEPGSVVRFGPGAGLEFGEFDPGRLVIPEGPGTVVMEGDSAGVGRWVGVVLKGEGLSELRRAVFRHCGGEKPFDQYLGCLRGDEGAQLLLDDVSIDGAWRVALTMGDWASFHPHSKDVSITGTQGHVAALHPSAAGGFPSGTFTANDANEIHLINGQTGDSLTLPDTGMPWRVLEGIYLAREQEPGSLLRIPPGQRMIMGPNARIEARGGSVVVGDASGSPVVFEAADPDVGWPGIVLSGRDVAGTFTSTTLSGCGRGIPCVSVQDFSTLEVHDLNIEDSKSVGIELNGGGQFVEGSAGLTVLRAADAPVVLQVPNVPTLPSGTYEGNGVDAIVVTTGGVGESATWADPGLPFRLESGLSIEASWPGDPVLTLLPGVTLEFTQGRWLSVGSLGSPGNLVAVGTAESPITFTSAEGDGPGSWAGVLLNNSVDTRTRLEYVVVSNAGGGDIVPAAAVTFRDDPGGLLANSILRNSANCGLAMLEGGSWITDYADPQLGNQFLDLLGPALCGG